MSKIEKLLDKTRRKGDTKKWKMYVFAVVGILIIVGGFFGTMALLNPIIDEYIISSKDIVSLYKFYDTHQKQTDTEIFFLGDSCIGNAIFPEEINDILNKSGHSNVTVYNLEISSDTPLQRALSIPEIINLKPSCVVYGVTYRSITSIQYAGDTVWNSDNAGLIGNRVTLTPNLKSLLSDEEIEDLQEGNNPMFKKRFLSSAVSNKLNNKNTGYRDYEIDPYRGKDARINMDPGSLEAIIKDVNNPKHNFRPVITNESTRHKDALLYNVRELENAGIHVVLINMPLHPLCSEKITDESRKNFFDLLNQTEANWYDYEYALDGEYFRDTHHMSYYGAHLFAPLMADLIIQELT